MISIKPRGRGIRTFEMPQGNTQTVTFDLSAEASDLGTTVSTVAWSVDEGNSVTISGTPSVSSNVSTGTLVADSSKEGCSLIKMAATMADSQIVTKFVKINVINPVC